jgi:SAM-dependent methyltransferase
MRQALDDALRPGGLTGTREALARVPLASGSVVLDAGCGPGRTAAFLQEEIRCRVIGLDRDQVFPQPCPESGPDFVRGDAGSLPLSRESLDAVFCECVLSLLPSPEQGLTEFYRVLKSGGRLYLSDIFARGWSSLPAGPSEATCLAAPVSLEAWKQRLQSCGFGIVSEQDQTWLMRQTAGRLIFEFGSLQLFWQAVLGPAAGRGCAARIKDMRPGYVSFVAIKDEAHE